jgi:uncharacterized membrane protein
MSEPTVPPPPSYNPPPPPPPYGGGPGGPVGPGAVSPNRSVMIVLSYLWILCLIPLLMEKEDREVQWHAKNGLALLVAEIAMWIVVSIFSGMMSFVDFGCSSCFITPLLIVVFLVVRILCIVKGINGQRFVIPGVSQFVDRF